MAPEGEAAEMDRAATVFSRKAYTPSALPEFSALRKKLPAPVYDEQTRWIDLYWKAWEIAFRNFHEPAPGSGLVSQFIDAAFNENIFLWDSCFMTMFCDAAHPLVPGISTLDNFYASQHSTGEISREISRETGIDFAPWRNTEDRPLFSRWGYSIPKRKGPFPVTYVDRSVPVPNPRVTLDGLNHPLLAWSELEHFRWTADRERLSMVWEPLVLYYRALQKYLRQGNGLYMTDWASMDNSPRNRFLEGGGTGIDISSEMVLFGRQLAEASGVLGKDGQAREFLKEAEALGGIINRLMWNEKERFYFDLTRDGKQVPVKTVAAYWTLLAGIASPSQAQDLVRELGNRRTFGRLNPVPTCSADDRGYKSFGGYWRGAVWAPTNTMVIRGLEKYGFGDLAAEIALKHIRLVSDVYEKTGTIWENYAPDAAKPGRIVRGMPVRRDFVGWSGIGPILYLLEHAIGLSVSGPDNLLTWTVRSDARCGCENFRFAGHVVSLVAEKPDAAGTRRIHIRSDGEFRMKLSWRGREKECAVHQGECELVV
jgi:hypothetical protein